VVSGGALTREGALEVLHTVKDPEVPALDVVEMGIVRRVEVAGRGVEVAITPTYSGCPAMKRIEDDIVRALSRAGFEPVEIEIVYRPAWTTDDWSDETREKLRAYGIAPPPRGSGARNPLPFSAPRIAIPCPHCRSTDTEVTSAFGSTPCKSLHVCHACHEPFEHFKCH